MQIRTVRDLGIILLSLILLTAAVWLPFYLKIEFLGLNFNQGFNTIYQNYDGLEYIAVAKSWYNTHTITQYGLGLSPQYFASRFPGFPFLIWLIAPFFGFLKSMIFITLFFTYASAAIFYIAIKDLKLTNHPLLLSLLFLILPARWVIIHSVGSPEPMFIFFTISCFYFLMKYELSQKWRFIHFSALFGAAAQLTRPPGSLIFISIAVFLLFKLINGKEGNFFKRLLDLFLKYHPFVLLPAALLFVFALFQNVYGDFFAYFHSGDNIHLGLIPFAVFNKGQAWVGDIWLEDIIYIYLLSLLGGIFLLKQKLYPIGIFVLTFTTASIFVAHRDISRYIIPVFPFVLIAFEKVLTSKEFRIVAAIMLLGIILYSQNFLLQNTAPIAELKFFN
jgi:hypothetical protein